MIRESMFTNCSVNGKTDFLVSVETFILLVPPAVIETATCGLGNRRSIH